MTWYKLRVAGHDAELAAALGKVASGIFVVTTKIGPEESVLLASWVQQASFQPPTLTVAVRKNRSIGSFLGRKAHFAVHVLSKDNRDLYQRFVKGVPVGEKPFKGLNVKEGASGIPILIDALAVLECRVRDHVECGDHRLIIADIESGRILNDGEAWVHIRKNGFGY